jgi:hypothetical protein
MQKGHALESDRKKEVEMVVNRIAPAVLPSSFTVIPSADIVQDTSVAPQKGSFGEVCECNWNDTPFAVK